MKKLNILFTLLIAFFVGTVGVKAIQVKSFTPITDWPADEACEYKSGSFTYKMKNLCDDPAMVVVNDTTNEETRIEEKYIKFDLNIYNCDRKCPTLYQLVKDENGNAVASNLYAPNFADSGKYFMSLYWCQAKIDDKKNIIWSDSHKKDYEPVDFNIKYEFIKTEKQCTQYANALKGTATQDKSKTNIKKLTPTTAKQEVKEVLGNVCTYHYVNGDDDFYYQVSVESRLPIMVLSTAKEYADSTYGYIMSIDEKYLNFDIRSYNTYDGICPTLYYNANNFNVYAPYFGINSKLEKPWACYQEYTTGQTIWTNRDINSVAGVWKIVPWLTTQELCAQYINADEGNVKQDTSNKNAKQLNSMPHGYGNFDFKDESYCVYHYVNKNDDYYYAVEYIRDDPSLHLYDSNYKELAEIDQKYLNFNLTLFNCPDDVCECKTLYYNANNFNVFAPYFSLNSSLTTTYACYEKNGKEYLWTDESVVLGGWAKVPGISSEWECKKYVGEHLEDRGGSFLVSCGNGTMRNIPHRLIKIIKTLIRVIQIGTPILLIIFGMIDFAKGITSQKEDEITKGRKTFFTRLITALLVFFVIFIVKVAVRFVNEKTDSAEIIACIDCFVNDICD